MVGRQHHSNPIRESQSGKARLYAHIRPASLKNSSTVCRPERWGPRHAADPAACDDERDRRARNRPSGSRHRTGMASASSSDSAPHLHPSESWRIKTRYIRLLILSNWSRRDWRRSEGVQLRRCKPMQRIVLRTHQHAYEIFVRSVQPGTCSSAADSFRSSPKPK